MDNVTHTLFALTLARTPLGRAGRGATAALILASNAPDVDIVTTARGSLSYLHWHRGPTHGPIGVLALGIASAGAVWLWLNLADRKQQRDRTGTPAASFLMLCAVCVIAALLHVAMDLPTSYGVRLFSPFDWHWFAVDWLPIVDGYLLGALAIALIFGRASAAAGRRNAAIVLALMAANYGIRGVAHHRALVAAPQVFGARLPARCDPAFDTSGVIDRWPRIGMKMTSDAAGKRCLVEVAAMPSFLSPFKWRLIAELSNAYELQDIDLLDGRLRADAATTWRVTLRPNVWTPQAASAAATPQAQIFLGFSRFPEARALTDRSGAATVRFNDIRFAGGLLALTPGRPEPFTLTMQLAPDGRVVTSKLGW